MHAAEQARFTERVASFIERKNFDGRDGFSITPEVKLSIAASAVQLTLGLETWDLSFFRHILVFASDYISPATGKLHKGETNMGGFVCFSWEAFREGYAIPHDKINLGLHEFAHALRFNGVGGASGDYFFENYFARWLACAYSEFNKLKENIPGSIFRKYGGVNIEEFFSVTVETFFETPLEFKTALPELYLQTSILLNQTFLDDGSVIIGGREEWMKGSDFELSKDYSDTMHFYPGSPGLIAMTVLCVLAGVFLVLWQGASQPLSYIPFGIAAVSWIYAERKSVRLSFGKKQLLVSKGLFFLKGKNTFTIPYSHLISFKVPEDVTEQGSASVAYYHKGNFYKDRFRFRALQPKFDELRTELEHNMIFVKMKS